MATDPRPHLTLAIAGDNVSVVGFSDKVLRDDLVLLEIRAQLYHLLDGNHQRILVNFSGMMDCATYLFGILLGLLKRLRPLGGSVKLCCLEELPGEAIRICGLHTVFEVFDAEESALASFNS